MCGMLEAVADLLEPRALAAESSRVATGLAKIAVGTSDVTVPLDDKRFADTSIWVSTSRKWVTLKGCVRTKAQRGAIVKLVQKTAGVERVFDEMNSAPR